MGDDTKLGRELAELERTDPAVKAAAENYERVRDSIIHRECRADLAAARQRIGELEADEADDECEIRELNYKVIELERERDAARKYLADAGEEMRARWHAINESLAENRALATQLTVAREALETLRRMAANPMKSWDAGHVIDAQRVDEIAEEALEAIAPTPTRTASAPQPTCETCGGTQMRDPRHSDALCPDCGGRETT
jgi:DNA repair exonuclease SbcCD ATPase subunit